jgi:RsiW-degrading membrane proteinase PrsW (M82 family)
MHASTFVYAILAGILPSLIWLWFWIREDSHAEPRWLLVATFLGGFLAVIAAVFAEKFIAGLAIDSSLRYTLWAGVEEIFKFVAVAVIALNTDYNDEPIDAMVYCIVVALGFAALENTLFLIQPLAGGEIAQSIVTGNMRFMGATLVHIVSSAVVGFGLGFAFYRGYFAKVTAVIVGLACAITLHAAFNLSIINGNTADTLKAFAWVWGAVVILIILFEEVKVVKPKLS